MPLNIKGNQSTDIAQTNRWALQIEAQLASLQKKAKDVPNVAAKVASAQSSSGKITLTAPPEITVVGSPAALGGEFDLSWKEEADGTVLGVPTATALEAGYDSSGVGTSSTSVISASATPTQTGDYALFFGCAAASTTAAVSGVPSGFTSIDPSQGLSGKVVSGLAEVSASVNATVVGINPASAGAMILLSTGGTTPSVVQHNAGSGAFAIPGTASATVTLGASATVGNSLLVLVSCAAGTYGALNSATIANIQDNKKNPYQLIAIAGDDVGAAGQFTKVQVYAYLTRVKFSGTSAITVSATGAVGNVLAGVSYTVYELSGVIASTTDIPRFVNPFFTMGPINLGTFEMGGGVTGLLDLAHGGTDADLTASGGTNNVLFQQTVGSPITVGPLDYDKLPGQALPTTFNNVTLHGLGLTSIVGVANSTTNSADIATTGLSTGAPSGLFRVTFYLAVTTAATISSTLPSLTLTWQDPDNNAAQSVTFVPTAPSGNTLTTLLTENITVYHKPGAANLSYATTGYASSGATAMTYSVHIRVEQLGF